MFSQKYVCLFRRGHPLDGRSVSPDDFQRAEHLHLVSAGTIHGQVDELMRGANIQRDVRLTIPHLISAGHILRSTDLVATVTETLAASLAEPFRLAYSAIPSICPRGWHQAVLARQGAPVAAASVAAGNGCRAVWQRRWLIQMLSSGQRGFTSKAY